MIVESLRARYGGIGRQCAVVGKALGMRILAQRRRPDMSSDDPIPDALDSQAELSELMAQSDYIVVAAQLTPETNKMVGAQAFAAAKEDDVLIKDGRVSGGGIGRNT